ncbi:MAG: hypothetical protein HQK50_01140 [Oligoflexia bacterium]|nr:hypothetical protein [Oligoflexia bacterium]
MIKLITITTITTLALFLSINLYATSESKSILWNDAGVMKRFYLLPEYMALFNLNNHQGKNINTTPFITIHSTSELKTKNIKLDPKSSSPLFSDTSDGKPKYALPGGVIVFFKSGVSDTAITSWAAQEGVQLLQRFPHHLQQKVWLISTPPGIESLKYADKFLSQKDLIDKTTPNWWYHAVAK